MSLRLPFLCLLCVIFPFLLFGPDAHGGEITGDLQVRLSAARPGEEVPIIVTFAEKADLHRYQAQARPQRIAGVVRALRQSAEISQREVRAMLRGKGKAYTSLWIVNSLALAGTPELVAELAARPEVAKISFDDVLELPSVTIGQASEAEWNIEAIGAPELWALGFTGEGVTVAVLDSGVYLDHPDLRDRWRGGANSWFDPYLGTSLPYDEDGHGTMVTGVVLGGNADGTAIGVAPGAVWIAAKIFDDAGLAVNSNIISSLQWLLDPDGDPATDDAPDVVNNSWGLEDLPGRCDSLFRAGVQNLKAAGIAVVSSAGNAGPDPQTAVSPANYPESYAVGAVDSSSAIAFFSSRGPSSCDNSIFPEVVAPGVHILTSDIGGYQVASGTSFAAPHVTGAMALLLSAFPELTPEDLEGVLQATATDLGGPNEDNEYGHGLVNILAAYSNLTGNPVLSVYDPAAPENDLSLAFGHQPPGTLIDQTITLRNAGEGFLHISEIGAVSPPFSVTADNCTNSNLTAAQSCTVTIQFAPQDFDFYQSAMEIRNNDPGQSTIILELTGHGNTLPSPARLLFPGNQASRVALPVTLEWSQAEDADGDALTHFVHISENSNFSDTVPMQVASGFPRSAMLAGTGGLFLVGVVSGLCRRRTLALILMASGLALLVACGSGGSSSDSSPIEPGSLFTFTPTDLEAGTLYYWKIVTEDSRGGAVESAVRSFTTAD